MACGWLAGAEGLWLSSKPAYFIALAKTALKMTSCVDYEAQGPGAVMGDGGDTCESQRTEPW